MATILVQIKRANITIIDEQLASLELVEARNQPSQTRFTGSCMSHKSDSFASLYGEVEPCQHALSLIITKEDIAQLYLALYTCYRLGSNLVDTWLGIQQGKNSLAGR